MRNKLRKWLGVKDPKEEVADIKKDLMESVKKEIEAWTQTVKAIGEIECSQCHKKVVTYPFGGGYYREADGTVYCSGECLDKKRG